MALVDMSLPDGQGTDLINQLRALAEDEISTHRVELAELRAENAKLRAALEEVAHGCLTEWGQVDVDKIDRVARAALRGEPK